jgi:hypothetical protein
MLGAYKPSPAEVKAALERKWYFNKKLQMDRALLLATIPFQKDSDIDYFQGELTYREKQAIIHIPEDMTSRKMWQVVNVGRGFQTIEYRELLRTGRAEFTSYGDDNVPRANVSSAQNFSPIRKAKIFYGWELEDIETQDFSTFSLQGESNIAAKNAMEYRFNNTAYFGATSKGLPGYFTWATGGYLNAVPQVAGLSAGADYTWATKLPEEILNDVIRLKLASGIATNSAIKSNVLGVGTEGYGLLQYSFFNGMGTGESVMDRIKSKGIFERIEECPELNNVTVAGLVTAKNVAIAYSDRPDVFKLHHPLEFTTLPLQIKGFSSRIYCHGNTAGLFLYQKYGGSYLLDI